MDKELTPREVARHAVTGSGLAGDFESQNS